ncbi:NucA/NucB deoxyribonuclease domain-containing protein [Streptomyces sp. TRM70308]|uniref:NucA/NucB deoxyribonuclease domain-containing protein n=1 Tax=Streptomyces sp. TRM70308 TaxID=3131932 RepID=UPI003D008854
MNVRAATRLGGKLKAAVALSVVAVLVPLAVPASAGASEAAAGQLQVESYVLPVGSVPVSGKSAGLPSARESLKGLSVDVSQGLLPPETVGPARELGHIAGEPSAQARPAEVVASGDAGAQGVTYPEPPRTMTAGECRKGLGSDKKLFIKSRFAICSSASFHQLWTRKGKPVGESAFDVLVIGTVARDSRAVTFSHHYVNLRKTGSTNTAGLMVTPKVTIPLMAPSTAKYKMSAALPGMKSFDQLKASPSFKRTMSVAPGQGSTGKTDLVASVYQASIELKFPPGYTVAGAKSGKLFMLPPRWDAAPYLRNSTGGGDPAKRGAGSFAVLTPLVYSAKADAPERGVAQHIRQAFTKPEETKPYMSAKKVPGNEPKTALNRLYHDKKRSDQNRAKAVAQCKRHFGENYTAGGKECDEYPFASTYQGAAEADHDPDAKKFNYSVKPVPAAQNKAAGDLLRGFYAKNRVLDGYEDGFWVQIVS